MSQVWFEVRGDRMEQVHDTVEHPKTFETFLLALLINREVR